MAAATLGFNATRFFTRVHRSRSNFFFFTPVTTNDGRFNNFQVGWNIIRNDYARDACIDKTVMIEDLNAVKPKKKKVFIPRVTLLTENDEMSVVTLEMAQKISARRNLKLIKILDFDTKTERPIYKLMTSKQYIEEEIEMKKRKKLVRETALKPEKIFSLSTKIDEHDLHTKLKSFVKLLSRKHEIQILISFDENKEKADEIFTRVSTAVKDLSPIITKSSSSRNLKIRLTPNLKAKITQDSPEKINDEPVPATST